MLPTKVVAASEEMSDEDRAAEEAAAAAVGEAAEEELEDEADAHDEEADSARFNSDKHPLTDMPPAAKDVQVGYAFTVGLDDSAVLTLGQEANTVIAFANGGRSLYHVWGVMGSLNMANYYNSFVQNFTYTVVNKTVSPDNELSFSYAFTPNERLDVRSFQLSLSVFYEAQGSTGNVIRAHSTTFYNATIETQPGPGSMSNGVFMLITFVLIGAGVGAYFVMKSTQTKNVTAPEMGTSSTSKNEWLEEHNNLVRTGGGRGKSKTSRQ